MASIRLPIRQLVEFCCAPAASTAALPASTAPTRAHASTANCKSRRRELSGRGFPPRRAGSLRHRLYAGRPGRRHFTDENGTVTIDEIKTTTVPYEEITEELNPCHWAQGMVYAAIYSSQQGLETLAVRLTYYQVDTDQILRFTRQFTRQQLEQFCSNY